MEPWLSFKDAVGYLNLSERKVRMLLREGKIKYAQPEKKLFFKQRWLDQYVMQYGNRLTAEQKQALEELS